MNKNIVNLNEIPSIGRLLQAYENIIELGFKYIRIMHEFGQFQPPL